MVKTQARKIAHAHRSVIHQGIGIILEARWAIRDGLYTNHHVNFIHQSSCKRYTPIIMSALYTNHYVNFIHQSSCKRYTPVIKRRFQ